MGVNDKMRRRKTKRQTRMTSRLTRKKNVWGPLRGIKKRTTMRWEKRSVRRVVLLWRGR